MSSNNNNRITSYFGSVQKKCKLQSNEDGTKDSETIAISNPTNTNCYDTSELINPIEIEKLHDIELDIGNFITQTNAINDYLKSVILQRSNVPSNDFQYPFSIHTKKGKSEKRFLRKNHFEKFPYIEFSKIKSGLFCKVCVLFSISNKGGMHKTEQLKSLVTEPVIKFAKLLGKDGILELHNNNGYHKDNIQRANDFLNTYNHPEKEVINLVNDQRKKQILDNRERLRPIIKTIVFLGQQNIPLRGHRDDGFINQEDGGKVDSVINQGNFKELLKFRIDAGDHLLKNHLKTTGERATYISKLTQNEIIECCKLEILHLILLEVKEAKYFSILFDETTDLSNISQMCLIIRYILHGKSYERFLTFIDCHSYVYNKRKHQQLDVHLEDNDEPQEILNSKLEPKLTGELLGNTVVKLLQELELDLNYCVGIGTDGCSVMISAVRGAVQQIRKIAKNAIHSSCSNHALNLSISKSSTVQSIRNCVGVIKEVTSFFHISAKRNYVLQQHLTNHRKLHNLCETRWIERHDSVLHFKESIIEIIDTLTEISGWQDNISSSKAKMMISAICNCEFIFSLFSLSNLLAVTFPISKILQGKDQDIVAASECIKDVYLILGQNREKCEEKFQSMFKECELILNKLDVDIKLPRIIAHQKHRVNATSSNNPVDYYRINIYIPLLDNVLEDFDFRFLSKENSNITLLIQLIPKYVVKMKTEDYNGYFAKIIEIMTKDYTYFQNVSEQAIENEINMWFTKWLRLQTEGKIYILI